jgi:asparagine synthase (glutamine-hydrolysing)
MSAQFGRWNFDGRPVEQGYLDKVQRLLAPYGQDDQRAYSQESISILYCAFHTTLEPRRESQPLVMSSGAILTWDGRLDNRDDLIRELGDNVTSESPDIAIVAAAYERWNADGFAKLIGDWALSIWEPRTRSLVLAKDPIGVRHLYYSFDETQVTWSTILDPLILCSGKTFRLCEEYAAGWFALFPATHLTPYENIHSVPPSSSVIISATRHAKKKYWDFNPGNQTRYRTDAEYEEHFRAALSEAVRRRLRSDTPVLAELSGGMDSSSIICMADIVLARGHAETPRLDTVSYYDDSEPNWNERPYFTKVEEKRGRTGTHIDVSLRAKPILEDNLHRFAVTPGSHSRSSEMLIACMDSAGHRVLLSGTGGDEATGGVPTPMPELEDLLAQVKFKTLAHQLKLWALNKRKPWFHLLFEAARGFLPSNLVGIPQYRRPAPWLNRAFIERHRKALQGYETRLKLFGSLPSFQDNLAALEGVRRQLECSPLSCEPLYEKRYPYLDRSLLEFLYSVPREQLVRPGHRRSLMRRALSGLVPDEILNRKRKAFVARGPLAAIATDWTSCVQLAQRSVSGSLGLIDATKYLETLQKARDGQEIAMAPLMRTIAIDKWLKSLVDHGLLTQELTAQSNLSPANEEHPIAI